MNPAPRARALAAALAACAPLPCLADGWSAVTAESIAWAVPALAGLALYEMAFHWWWAVLGLCALAFLCASLRLWRSLARRRRGLLALSIASLCALAIGHFIKLPDPKPNPVVAFFFGEHGALWKTASKPAAPPPAPTAPPLEPDLSWKRLSPNGQPWPAEEGALPTMPAKADNGREFLRIYKSGPPLPTLLKLCRVPAEPAGAGAEGGPEAPCEPVRWAYLRSRGAMILPRLEAGRYQLRALNLSTGAACASAPFDWADDPRKSQLSFDIDGAALRKCHALSAF